MPDRTGAGLAEPFRSDVLALVAASNGRVSITSGFRTRAEQTALRAQNGCPADLNAPARECRVPTAPPGTSKHERGLAVDFGGDLALAQSLASRFRMHRTVTGEPWHFEPLDSATAPGVPPSGASGPAGTSSGSTGSTGGGGGSLGAIAAAVRTILAGATWIRVLTALAGFAAIGIGVAMLAADILPVSTIAGAIPHPAAQAAAKAAEVLT